MAEPYVKTFEFPGPDGQMFALGAVVLDQSDFDDLIDEIVASGIAGVDEGMASSLKQAGHIPMVARGTKTAFLFERFEIKCDRLSLIVRGKGIEVVKQLVMPNPELN